MNLKKGDRVSVLTGKDKGKEGKVLQVLRKVERVVVEGINVVKRHQKPSNANQTGGIIEKEAPIHISNVKPLEAKKAETKEVKKETKTKKSNKKND
jgi:large subunit ribosomal protein L24